NPPTLERLSTQVYVAQGGSEVVTYRVGETAVRDGVQAGNWFFPGYPLPGGGPHDRMALFAMPYDEDQVGKLHLVAADDLGNTASLACADKFFPKPFKKDTIPLDDTFLGRVVPEILSHTPDLREKDNLLDSYLMLNRDLRKT